MVCNYDHLLEVWTEIILDALGTPVEDNNEYLLFHCPFHHPDKNPSFVFNLQKRYGFDYHTNEKFNLKELAEKLDVSLPSMKEINQEEGVTDESD